jgi:hypothetical protein
MRTIQCVRAGWMVAAVSVCTLIGGAALAATTTERPGSILIFPKVVTSGTRDTVIQITNTGNMPDELRCFYLNGQTCFETDFSVSLTKQQPTVWTARAGRRVNPTDSQKGLDPGLIPPLPVNFSGALICTEVDTSDFPTVRNQVKGEATLVDRSGSSTSGSVSKYNAIAVQGLNGNMDNTLKLDDTEYSACPASLVLNFLRDGEAAPVIKTLGNAGLCDANSSNPTAPCNQDSQCPGGTCQTGKSRVLTRLTVLPCTLDLASVTPTKVVLAFNGRAYDPASSNPDTGDFTGGHPFSCWDSFTVDTVGKSDVSTNGPGGVSPGGPIATMNIRGLNPAGGNSPVVGIAEYFVSDSLANTASAAVNLHTQGLCSAGTNFNKPCNRDVECPSGLCMFSGPGTTIEIPPEQ